MIPSRGKRRPVLVMSWFSPSMISSSALSFIGEPMTEEEVIDLLNRNACEGYFPEEKRLEELQDHLKVRIEPFPKTARIRLKNGDVVVWVRKTDGKFQFSKVTVVAAVMGAMKHTPYQYSLPIGSAG